jgi:GNAT superfamily N-acetyltransferase
MTGTVHIREATSADIPAMGACRRMDPDAGEADPRMADYLEGRHHPHQAALPRVAFVAVAGDTVVGYIAGHQTRRFGCDGEVQYLFVAPAYRRQGVATALLRALAAWFEQRTLAKVCVNVNVDSPGAPPFYERCGAKALNPHWYLWDDIVRGLRSRQDVQPGSDETT